MRITFSHAREAVLLFTGDVILFTFALWLTLLLRHLALPASDEFAQHIVPFSLLFAAWTIIFFVAGLYDKHTVIFKEKLPGRILWAQIFNVVLVALFFFFIPYFGITPKTNLVIYLVVSFILIVLWRVWIFPSVIAVIGKRKKQKAILIGSGREVEELRSEINHNNRYPFEFVEVIDPLNLKDPLMLSGDLIGRVSSGEVSVIVGNSSSPQFASLVPILSNLAFLRARFRFINIATLYENLFDRIPLSLIHSDWFLENVSTAPQRVYDILKRLMDIAASLILGTLLLFILPFVYIAIRLEDGGSVFICQERVGKDNQPVRIFKFRSMNGSDSGDQVLKSGNMVTRVGAFLRRTRLDEFPQLWNVLRGDISLIGPRLEFPAMVHQYAERIPHYNIRHVIKPGLTGWAQINHHEHPHHGIDFEETARKLSHDLYYIKNRSLMLDIHIALKTAKTLFSLAGR